jgi:RES domain-containing protein
LILSAWRITKQKHARSAFDGEGARLFGGRWNSPGVPMIYTAQSRALAALEMLVHLDSPDLLNKYVLFEVSMDPSYVRDLDIANLPRNWKADPTSAKVQAIGDDWVAAATSAVLRVPSTLVPGEFNFLLNPRHRDFGKLRIGTVIPFQFDPRLARR